MTTRQSQRQGRHAIIEQFLADGIDVMFGNPGTVEQGFLNALDSYPAMRYVLTLQETVAVFAGDGYARAGRRPALVQIHSSPGLGNALGAMYQANRGHSPLVVIEGDAGIKYQPMQSQMYADLVAMAAPVTKMSTMVQHPSSLLRVLRRAIKVAMTPPMGPVYVCLPADILDMPAEEAVHPSLVLRTDTAAPTDVVAAAAAVLMASRQPRLFIGDGIHYSRGAGSAVTRLAELIGADIYGVDAGESNVPLSHPLYSGQTGHMFGYSSKAITSAPDALLIAGTYMVPEVFPELGDIYDPAAKIVHVDLDAGAIAKNHRVDIGVVADPARALAAIADVIESTCSPDQAKLFSERRDRLATKIAADRHAERANFETDAAKPEATMAALAKELFARADRPILVDEGLTNSPPLVRYFADAGGETLIQTRGGSLGMGLASAIGVQIAHPDRTVVSVSGDGGAMYTIQSLWSAARHKLPIKYIVCNNGVYHLLELNIAEYWKTLGVEQGVPPTCFDLGSPLLHFEQIAKALSVPSAVVTSANEISEAVTRALAEPGPFLIDLRLDRRPHSSLIALKCGQ